MLSIFSCACWPSVYLLWKMSRQFLCPFLNRGVCFLDVELYILDSNSVSDTSFANIFSYPVDNLFVLLIISFSVHKGFLVWSSLVYFCFYVPCLRRHPPKILLRLMSKSYCLCFLPEFYGFRSYLNWNFYMEKRLVVAKEEEGWGERLGVWN